MLDAVLARFKEGPVLVSPENNATFEGCMSALARVPDIDKMMTQTSAHDDFWPTSAEDWRNYYRPYQVKDGILTIPVKGVLLHDFPWQAGSWATGYIYVEKALERGLEDGSVKGIALHCHTPGGDVAGCFELVDKLFAARGKKPIRAFAHEAAYSAGYAIASAADKIVVSRTGGVGSIGVVTAHLDVSKAMEDIGFKITFIHFGKHKVDGNPYEALSEETKARWQVRIDKLGAVFVKSVARNRGLDEKAVKDTEALTYSADEALSIGLADSIGPLDQAVADFSADLSNEEGEETMADFTQAQHDEALAVAVAAATATATTAGAAAERARVTAIMSLDSAKARPKSAMAAVKAGMTIEAATEFLTDLAEETTPAPKDEGKDNGQKFDEAMGKDKPGVGADTGDTTGTSRAKKTAAAMGWGDKKVA